MRCRAWSPGRGWRCRCGSKPSSSRKASPSQVPSGQAARMRAGTAPPTGRGWPRSPASSHRRAVFRRQRPQPPLAEPGRADHRHQVATEIARDAGVDRHHPQQVLAQPARLYQLHRRDAQALLLDFRRTGVVTSMGRAADIALVGAHDGPEQPPSAWTGMNDGEVGKVAAAVIGVVQQEDVARRMSPAKASATASPPRAWRRHAPGYGRPAPPAGLRVAQRDGEVATRS